MLVSIVDKQGHVVDVEDPREFIFCVAEDGEKITDSGITFRLMGGVLYIDPPDNGYALSFLIDREDEGIRLILGKVSVQGTDGT